MLGMAASAIICGTVLAFVPLEPSRATTLLLVILLAGAFVNGVQTTMYALVAHIYPTEIRGTGVGTAVAIGRMGTYSRPMPDRSHSIAGARAAIS